MKAFFSGVAAVVAAAVLSVFFFGFTGRISMRADILPSSVEKRVAMRMMDANVERNAPKIANPVPATDENLAAGAMLYRKHCAVCHGEPGQPESPLAGTLYPPPPQFLTDAPDMAENENYYILVHGVRWTGMPGWKNVLTDPEIWQLVAFLSHLDHLPPAAKLVFAPSGNGPAPAPAKPMKMPGMKM